MVDAEGIEPSTCRLRVAALLYYVHLLPDTMMYVLVSVYRAPSAAFWELRFYQLLLLFIQGIYKSDYSHLG